MIVPNSYVIHGSPVVKGFLISVCRLSGRFPYSLSPYRECPKLFTAP